MSLQSVSYNMEYLASAIQETEYQMLKLKNKTIKLSDDVISF